MAVDWGFAGQVGGFGFGLVFVVLIILAAAIWVVGMLTRRAGAAKNKTEAQKKGD
jgi:Na+-transporting methylmalonyl-CoA/oxaloacetate decarboxylase gamma subunit